MSTEKFEEMRDPAKIFDWLTTYQSHEHLADIKEVSLEKYLAVAGDVYVVASMLSAALSVSSEQKSFAEYGLAEKDQVKPWQELSEEEKISEAPLRKAYLDGLRKGHDLATVELANRITYAVRDQLNRYRLENPEFDPDLVLDDRDIPDVD